MKTPEGTRIVAIVTDISGRKHAEQRSILQRDVALILSTADAIETVALKLLETISASLGWRLGALWLVDAESEVLRSAGFWRATGVEAPEFEAASRRLTFRMGECFLGSVWKNGKPEWVSDLAMVEGFLRAEEARVNGLGLELNLYGGKCFAAIEPSRLEQILMNLVANSSDAMRGGGVVIISTTLVDVDEQDAALYVGLKPRKYVTLRVADAGHGIAPEVLPHIFEPFFTTKGGEGRGNGLGLSTVYGIVRQHEGNISCESAPGQGAAFTIFLPAAEPSAATTETQASSKVRRGTETVLLVEDEPALRASVRRILEQNGYKVVVASNGVEALRAAEDQQNAFDLLVTDIALPQMRGIELAERLLQRHPQTRVLYMSGYSEEKLPLGVSHFIAKPFRREAFIRKVQEILDS